jgi:hypothetical protein
MLTLYFRDSSVIYQIEINKTANCKDKQTALTAAKKMTGEVKRLGTTVTALLRQDNARQSQRRPAGVGPAAVNTEDKLGAFYVMRAGPRQPAKHFWHAVVLFVIFCHKLGHAARVTAKISRKAVQLLAAAGRQRLAFRNSAPERTVPHDITGQPARPFDRFATAAKGSGFLGLKKAEWAVKVVHDRQLVAPELVAVGHSLLKSRINQLSVELRKSGFG